MLVSAGTHELTHCSLRPFEPLEPSTRGAQEHIGHWGIPTQKVLQDGVQTGKILPKSPVFRQFLGTSS